MFERGEVSTWAHGSVYSAWKGRGSILSATRRPVKGRERVYDVVVGGTVDAGVRDLLPYEEADVLMLCPAAWAVKRWSDNATMYQDRVLADAVAMCYPFDGVGGEEVLVLCRQTPVTLALWRVNLACRVRSLCRELDCYDAPLSVTEECRMRARNGTNVLIRRSDHVHMVTLEAHVPAALGRATTAALVLARLKRTAPCLQRIMAPAPQPSDRPIDLLAAIYHSFDQCVSIEKEEEVVRRINGYLYG